MASKAVIFDIEHFSSRRCEIKRQIKALNLSTKSTSTVLEAVKKWIEKLERGDLYSEVIAGLNKDIRSNLENDFDVTCLFQNVFYFNNTIQIEDKILHAMKVLRKGGVKTCLVTNDWIDDRENEGREMSRFMLNLGRYVDVVIRSSLEGIRKPDPQLLHLACNKLEVQPANVIVLDTNEEHLQVAAEFGMKCIKITTPDQTNKKLQEVTSLDITSNKRPGKIYPPPCRPTDVQHNIARLKTGIQLHYVEAGDGPVVMLFHGFPEGWYSWRYQIPALANAGYRAIALDQRGYGDSSAPDDVEEYNLKKICQDAIDFMDHLGISQAAIAGHDWGGAVIWSLALHFPNRIKAVCGLNTPIHTGEGRKMLANQSGVFNYMKYFQKPGAGEQEFESNYERTFKLFFRSADDVSPVNSKGPNMDTSNVVERGGFFVDLPQDIPIGRMISEEDLSYYVSQFKKNGFRGPLSWYRNLGKPLEWHVKVMERKIHVPALMITATHDFVLKPEFSYGMEERVTRLSRAEIQNCSHWSQMDKPDEVNDAIINWLDKIYDK